MSFRIPNYKQSGPTTAWKSEKQRLMVLGRLLNAGVEVDPGTPPQECWKHLTELLVSELR